MSRLASQDIVIKQQLASGKSKAQIARELGVPVSTLKSYLESRAGRPGPALNRRLAKYGLTLEEYSGMLIQQGFLCASCGDPLSLWLTSHVHLDHHHGTNEVCGVLCRFCNVALGQLKDSPERAKALAVYAERTRG